VTESVVGVALVVVVVVVVMVGFNRKRG